MFRQLNDGLLWKVYGITFKMEILFVWIKHEFKFMCA